MEIHKLKHYRAFIALCQTAYLPVSPANRFTLTLMLHVVSDPPAHGVHSKPCWNSCRERAEADAGVVDRAARNAVVERKFNIVGDDGFGIFLPQNCDRYSIPSPDFGFLVFVVQRFCFQNKKMTIGHAFAIIKPSP